MAKKELYLYTQISGTINQNYEYNTFIENAFYNPVYVAFGKSINVEKIVTFTPEFDKNLDITIVGSSTNEDNENIYQVYYNKTLETYMIIRFKVMNDIWSRGEVDRYNDLINGGKLVWNLYQPNYLGYIKNAPKSERIINDFAETDTTEIVLYSSDDTRFSNDYGLYSTGCLVTLISTKNIWEHSVYKSGGNDYYTSMLLENTTSNNKPLYFYQYEFGDGVTTDDNKIWLTKDYIKKIFLDYDWKKIKNSQYDIEINKEKINIVYGISTNEGQSTYIAHPISAEGRAGYDIQLWDNINNTIFYNEYEIPESYSFIEKIRFMIYKY